MEDFAEPGVHLGFFEAESKAGVKQSFKVVHIGLAHIKWNLKVNIKM